MPFELEVTPASVRAVVPAVRMGAGSFVFAGTWLVVSALAVARLVGSPPREAGPWLAVAALSAVSLLLVFVCVHSRIGREVLTIADGALVVRVETGRLRRTKRYALADVERLRMDEERAARDFQDSSPYPSGAVVFLHRGRPVRFGASLSDAEAARLAHALSARIDALRRGT